MTEYVTLVRQTLATTFSAERLKRLRAVLAPIVTVLILGIMLVWAWLNRALVTQTFVDLGAVRLVGMAVLLTIVFILSGIVFTLLVKTMGYSFSFLNGYNYLNLSQIAAMLPGKVWGYAGLAGLLWTSGVSKRDSVLIITLNIMLMLSACAVVGLVGLAPVFGWVSIVIAIAPMLVLIVGRSWLDALRARFFPGTSPLPSGRALLGIFAIGILNWILLAVCFAWLAYSGAEIPDASPFLVAGSYPAGYIAGFVSLIAPSGLGVSEGVTALILEPSIGVERALAIGIAFRIILTTIQWLNIGISLLLANMPTRKMA